jgi:hypothetical protein
VVVRGRSLAVVRQPSIAVTAPRSSVSAGASATVRLRGVDATPPPTAIVHGASRATVSAAHLGIVPPRAEVTNRVRAVASTPSLSIAPPGAGVGVSVVASPPPPVTLEVGTFRRFGAKPHMFGSSMAGAALALVNRANPTHPVYEYDSQGPTNSDVIASVPVLWLDLLVSNSSATENLYVMVFDSATVPANGALPIRQPVELGFGHQTFVDVGVLGADGISGRPTLNGLCWAASTTPGTLTQDTTSSIWATANYILQGT